MFVDTYSYGQLIPVPEFPESATDALEALKSSQAEFGICRRCYEMSYGAPSDSDLHRRIAIMSVGGIGNEILDDSNEHALAELGAAWAPECHVHNGVGTAVCIDPADVDPDVLADMIHVAEYFDDYPVLDEQDYSDREFEAFVECFDDESRFIEWRAGLSLDLDRDHPAYAAASEYAVENYLGYSDPGYISREHVAESWRAAGVDIPDEL